MERHCHGLGCRAADRKPSAVRGKHRPPNSGTNAAGIVVVPGTAPVGEFSVDPSSNFTHGSLLITISGLGSRQVFASNNANGFGSGDPPTNVFQRCLREFVWDVFDQRSANRVSGFRLGCRRQWWWLRSDSICRSRTFHVRDGPRRHGLRWLVDVAAAEATAPGRHERGAAALALRASIA